MNKTKLYQFYYKRIAFSVETPIALCQDHKKEFNRAFKKDGCYMKSAGQTDKPCAICEHIRDTKEFIPESEDV